MANNSDEIRADGLFNGFESTIPKVLGILETLEQTKKELINYVDNINNGTDESLKKDKNFNKLKGFSYQKIQECIDLLRGNEELFNNTEFFRILNNDVNTLNSHVLQLKGDSPLDVGRMFYNAQNFMESFRAIEVAIIVLKKTNAILVDELTPKIEEVKEKIKDFDSLRLALEHRETSSIYLDLHEKYKKEFEQNNNYFFGTLIIAVIITFLTSIKINSLNVFFTTELNYWVLFITIKVLILTITITLCTLFLRRASHAKKLNEQAYQTFVEINAFPIHVRSLKDEDKHELIKELALKYFGKELDQTQNDKIGDLMRDQLAAGTELIKASAEMVKAKGSSTPQP